MKYIEYKNADGTTSRYIPVHERIIALKNDKNNDDSNINAYSIETSYEKIDDYWVVKATVSIIENDKTEVYNGTSMGKIGQGNFDNIETIETSAVGRALGMAGYGIQFGIASNEEVKKVAEVVDGIIDSLPK